MNLLQRLVRRVEKHVEHDDQPLGTTHLPRGSRGAAEVQPRGSREVAKIQPRCSVVWRTSLLPLFEAVREARADIALTLLSVPPERTSARIASRSSRSYAPTVTR